MNATLPQRDFASSAALSDAGSDASSAALSDAGSDASSAALSDAGSNAGSNAGSGAGSGAGSDAGSNAVPVGRACYVAQEGYLWRETEILVEIRNVSRTFQAPAGSKGAAATATHALSDVSLDIRRGEFLSIIGPSGCGKTTLLRLIAGLDFPQSGTVNFAGMPVLAPSAERGFMFQQGALFPWKTVAGNIATGLKARGVYQQRRQMVSRFISLVGLDGFEHAYPHQLSGGMAQRAAIARALINEPAALLMDEPLGALDAFTRFELQDKLLDLHKQVQSTMILVTHDVDEALYLSDRIVIMTSRPGKISEIIRPMLGKQRARDDPDFIALRSRILKALHLAGEKPEPEFRI